MAGTRPHSRPEPSEDVVGTLCIDGQPLTETDIERTRTDRAARIDQTRRAVIAVAAFAHDRAECSELLEMLGFDVPAIAMAREQLRREHEMTQARAS